ncbi:MAG: hypothetical protein ACYDEV_10250 [Acidiferrobacter sp.]
MVTGIYESVQTLRRFPGMGYKYRAETEERSESCCMDITGSRIC